MAQSAPDGEAQDHPTRIADIVREHCTRMRAEAGYALVDAASSTSFGDGFAEFEGPLLRWRFVRDRSILTADVAAVDPAATSGWTDWVQFLNVLHALSDEGAVEQLFASGQRGRKGYRTLGRLVDSRHDAVVIAFGPAEREGTLDRARAAQSAYLDGLYG